ncbi:RNA polymerase sigma factor [Maribacter antarcticus]|uniref:RNA polymerase sigma factor n=1 Tax=Maribacter antarcticus TaxID=505250 RepID=UPI00047A53E7|nr:sigma-70 family RNA polymerase sigma factor [Maribacter antarcticus]
MERQTDQSLFEALKEGSEIAFKKVYEDNRDLFLNFAKRYDLGDDEILDVYQDTYVALYENIENGKCTELKSSLSTYLISIGKYKIMERLRKNNKKINNEFILSSVVDVDIEIEDFDIVYEVLSPEQKLLKQYFERLGDKCKRILTLFYYKQYNINQIMVAGGYNSENVVKSQKSRCLKTLKEAIKNDPST